jgi:hypothetical protein
LTFAECEVVADAGTRLRIIADGMFATAAIGNMGRGEAEAWKQMARHVDEVRVRLCALPIETEGEAA